MSLFSQIQSASVPRTDMEDVIDYFKTEYRGSKVRGDKRVYEWQSKLADRLAPIAGVNRDSIMRRFQAGRTGRAKTNEQTEREYKELGEQLPPILPSGGVVNGVIFLKFSDGECEERYIENEHVSGATIRAMYHKNIEQSVVNQWMEQDEDEPIAVIGDCHPPQLTFTPIYD